MLVLVIEDDEWISEMLRVGLLGNGFQVDMAHDGLQGSDLIKKNKYDLIITDVMMPGKSGIELCREIREEDPSIPIIMLTALDSTDDKILGFEAGADDYLVKPFDFRELLIRIKALTRRFIQHTEHAKLKYHDLEIDITERMVFRKGQVIKLTPREFQLLEYMMKNAERVISKMELSREVWEKNFDTGTNFVDVYINYLRNKVDRNFENKLIHTRQGMGFLLKSEE